MNKVEFLNTLGGRLSRLPAEDVVQSLAYYEEMIDDRMDEGMTEAEAVADLGSVDDIADQILSEISLPSLVKARARSSRTLRAWEIVLLVLGSPVWLPLAVAALTVIFAVYAVLWAADVCCYAVTAAVAASALALLGAGVILTVRGLASTGLLLWAGTLVCAGLSIPLFLGSNLATKGIARGSRGVGRWLKARIAGREAAV